MVYVEDHPILDGIASWLRLRSRRSKRWADFTRESECIEFTEPATGEHYEIVVRRIDERSTPAEAALR